ncbi:MAG: alpha/beta fold hydrolase [Fulvivirga sp.]|nr:alpha/beta fold hydrolase [Fulvivirga sp.]
MELNYKKFGEGQPLIILHGLFGSLDNWQTIAKELADHFDVYIVDQRNHGHSPHSDEFNYDVMAADLNEFIDQHDLKNPYILGHSMGGKTAMKFALNHTDRWEKLIVVDIAPKSYPVHHDQIIEGLKAINVEQLESRGEADKKLAEYVDEKGVRQFLLKNLSRNNNGGFKWKINLAVIAENIEAIGEGMEEQLAIEKDVLFIRGENSDYIKDKDNILIVQHFPNSKVVTIKDAGHWIHAEKPEEFVETVKSFLR